MILHLKRLTETQGACLGRLDGLSQTIWTLEDAWNNNKKGNSCVPKGTYSCIPHGWHNEPVKKKQVWELLNVPQRTSILMHIGNKIGDTDGCVLCGFGLTIGFDSVMITRSTDAINLMRREIGDNPFTLVIE